MPQLRQLRLAEPVRVLQRGVAGFPTARDPVFDAGIEFRAEQLLEDVALVSTRVRGAWVGDERAQEVVVLGEVFGDAEEVVGDDAGLGLEGGPRGFNLSIGGVKLGC